MSSQPAAQRVLRFGLFELDLAAAELRKQGRKIRLQDQPLQVLELLLSRPGEIVSREELQQALWPADTFVEFDQGLNTAIKKIRLALGDSAENPRFVETIPRKGYRFIAPVERIATPNTAAQPAGWRPRLWVAPVLGIALVAAASVWFLRANRNPELAPVPVPLTAYPGDEVSPSFSPDGNYVAFAWNPSETLGQGNFGIYVKLIGGGDPVQLTHGPADDFSPVWSPDGRFIVFLRRLSPAASGVILVPAIGGAERKLGEIYQDEPLRVYLGPYLCWSPDSKWLLVADKESPDRPFGLFRLSVETGEKQRLIPPQERSFGDLSPAVSPDGRALVFSRWTRSHIRDLYLVELSESLNPVSAPRRLTFDTNAGDPAWTSDGRGIVFSAGPRHTPNLWKLTLSQPGWRPGKLERLAFAGEGGEPVISRQGRLAYGRRSMDVDIWRLELNGGRPATNPPVRLIASTLVDHEPQYSPDGTRILFGSNRSGGLELWVCKSDGSNAIQLTSFGGSHYTASPRWSPNGRLIAFTSTVPGKVDSYVINAEGGRPQLLAIEDMQNWSRDGKWIYFGSSRSGDSQLWKRPWPLAEHASQPVQVTKKGFTDLAIESPDGKFVYYLKRIDKYESSLWRLPVEGGEETQVLGSIVYDNFAVLSEGIYFTPNSPPFAVRFLSFATGKDVTVAPMPREPGWGFSVSSDGRWLLYCRLDAVRADLMLAENFR